MWERGRRWHWSASPAAALDVTIQVQILALMAQLQAEGGTAILLITHDMGVVAENSDRLAVMYAGMVVETGRTEDVLASPAHPYTRLLLRSIPTLEARRGVALDVIDGVVPEPGSWPAGCRFAPRCPYAATACSDSVPALNTVSEGRAAACIRLGEIGE